MSNEPDAKAMIDARGRWLEWRAGIWVEIPKEQIEADLRTMRETLQTAITRHFGDIPIPTDYWRKAWFDGL